MSIEIKDEFLNEVKKHLRIFHNEDDVLIKNEIEVAITDIYEMLLQTPKVPASSDKLSAKQKLAVKHMVAMFRSNPDGVQGINSRITVINHRLIRRILGSELSYYPKDNTKVV